MSKITPPPLTEEKLEEYIKDRMLFRKEQFVMEPSFMNPQGGLFRDVCQDWQTKYIYEPIDARDQRGFPKYQLLYIQLPKKSGKTALIAGECIVQLLLNSRPTEENYLLGGDKDQASYLLEKMKNFINRNPNFADIFTIFKNEITVPSTGAKIKVLSSEASTKQGKNPDFAVFDEFWNQPDRELWDTMFLGLAAKPQGQIIIITNAGYDEKTICYSVREMTKSGNFKKFYHFEPTGNLLESLKMPWITQDWLEIERAGVPPNVFNRFRKNLWVIGGENPFMPDEGWECFKPIRQKSMCNTGPHYVGIDIGLKKDAAAGVVLHREGRKLVIDVMRRWLGSHEAPVQIKDIEDFLIMCIKNFNECTLICDPWQAMGTIQKFRAVDIPVIEFYLTVQNISKLSKNLYYLFRNVSMDIPKYDKLEDELKGLQVVQKSYGWRIDHEKDTASDISIALGMAALDAMEKGIDEFSAKDLSDLYYIDQSSIYKSVSKRQYANSNIEILSDIPEDEIKHITFGKRRF